MKIHSNYEGCIGKGSSDNQLDVELPIIFKNFKSGPEGLASITAVSSKINSKQFSTATTVSIHPYSAHNDGTTIAGEPILSRPINFQSNINSTDNLLVFKFSIQAPTDFDYDSHLENDNNAEFVLGFNFTNFQNVEISISCQLSNSPKHKLKITSVFRTKKNKQVLLNLGGLTLLSILLVYWNTKYNDDVYLSGTWDQKTIAYITGSVLTFFGLSMRKLKSHLFNFESLKSLIEYPELHLNLELYQSLNTKAWTRVLLVVSLIILFIVSFNWSVEVQNKSNFIIYDDDKDSIVNSKSIYSRHIIQNPERFILICNETNQRIPNNPYKLGKIKLNGKVQFNSLEVKFFEGRNVDIPEDTDKKNVNEWDFTANLFEQGISLDKIICGKSRELPMKIGNINIIPEYDKSNKLRIINLRQKQEIELSQLEKEIKKFKTENFGNKTAIEIYRDRENMISKLETKLKEKIGNNIVRYEDINHITISMLDEVLDKDHKKRAIERNVLLSAFWKATKDARKRTPYGNEIEAICDNAKRLFEKDFGTESNRSIAEFLLEVYRLNSGTSEAPHNYIVKYWINRPSKTAEDLKNEINDKMLHYLAILALKGEENLEKVLEFFNSNFANITEYNGRQRNIYKLILEDRELKNSGSLVWNESKKNKLKEIIEKLLQTASNNEKKRTPT
ncbi:hypothetical protein [Flagellimonas algicola]|uniref:Uncharacterized protein n=1 Tax=Flagellimonas algicola TaxID=2583815 RepID=A0ABY2WJK0_9FLAO|nr:hypothetical protein [Allomuricauda algicola]TMU54825.1 hypothetical protein FGG15_11535 [Allomuricauda algicola]